MNKIKIVCQYCGKTYSPVNDRDCCPSCGAFNEFDKNAQSIQPVQRIEHIHVKKKTSALSIFGGIMLFFLVIGIIVGDDEDTEKKDTYNSSQYETLYEYEGVISNQNISTEKITLSSGDEVIIASGNVDYDTFNSSKNAYVKGTFQEIYNIVEKMSEYQLGWLDTNISTDCKLSINNTTIYIDDIELEYYGCNNDILLTIDVESTEKGIAPQEMDIYFVKGDIKDRLKPNKYGFCFEERINSIKDIFTEQGVFSTYWIITASKLYEYDTMEIVINGETYSYKLKFDDVETQLSYYQQQENP